MEPTITSAGNDTVKQLRKLLSSSKARRDANTYAAEGIHLVQSLIAASYIPTLVVLAESALHNDEIATLLEQLDEQHVRRVVLADSLFASTTSIHAPVGILALFTPKQPTIAEYLAEDAVLLDDIQDPGNLGTILRTTAAVGIQHVFLSAQCASPWSPKALRAGMGAQLSLTIHEDTALTSIVEASTITSFATTLEADSQSLYSLDLIPPSLWIFGNEGQGVSEALASKATVRVAIPQVVTAVESLNVGAATAVCLYEQYRQRHF